MLIDPRHQTASINAQAQIRRNVVEQNEVLRGFSSWEDEIRRQDGEIQKKHQQSTATFSTAPEDDNIMVADDASGGGSQNKDLQLKYKGDNVPTGIKQNCSVVLETFSNKTPSTNPVPVATMNIEQSSSNCITFEQKEEYEREKGNKFYYQGKYEDALKCYGRCIGLNPKSVVAYSNRAMVYLKMKDWSRAETDASTAICLDSKHVKSYQRRSAARLSLGKIRAAVKDLYRAQNAVKEKVDGTFIDTSRAKSFLWSAIKKAPKRKVGIRIVSVALHKVSARGLSSKVKSPKYNTFGTNSDLVSPQPLSTTLPLPSNHVARLAVKKARSWCEFEQIWTSFTNVEKECAVQDKSFPRLISKLYSNGLENVNVLLDLVHTCAHIDNHRGLKLLGVVSELPSIDMLVMMMTPAEKSQFIKDVKLISISARDEISETIECKLGLGQNP